VNLGGLHPKVIEAMGKMHYRTSYGQNVLRHSVEVAFLSQIIAEQWGSTASSPGAAGSCTTSARRWTTRWRAGTPRSAWTSPAARREGRGGAQRHRRAPRRHPVDDLLHAHRHGRGRDQSAPAPAPGVSRSSGTSAATSFDGVREAYAIQAGREVRVIVDAKKIDDGTSVKVARDIANRVEAEMTYPGEVRVTVLREVRAVEYAR
jgi:ribonuclease Y